MATRIFGKLIQEGKFGHIGLSEVLDSRIIRQAHSVSLRKCIAFGTRVDVWLVKTFPITALEVEVSPWSYGQDVQEGKVSSYILHLEGISYISAYGSHRHL